jgi:hypothetical protein
LDGIRRDNESVSFVVVVVGVVVDVDESVPPEAATCPGGMWPGI